MGKLANIERDDPNFQRDLRRSRPSLWKVAQWLGDVYGCDVIVPALKIRPDIELREDYSDSGDLFISGGKKNHENDRVEVKQRRKIPFTCRKDWPYPTMIVDAAHLWDKAEPKPIAYVIVNPARTACAIIDTKSADGWVKTRRMDTEKNRLRDFYECEMDCVKFRPLPVPAW